MTSPNGRSTRITRIPPRAAVWNGMCMQHASKMHAFFRSFGLLRRSAQCMIDWPTSSQHERL